MQYDETCLEYFLAHQEQLLPEPLAETMEEAEEFLEDCMAVVCKNLKEVKAYFEDQGLILRECHSRIWRRQAKYLPSRMADI